MRNVGKKREASAVDIVKGKFLLPKRHFKHSEKNNLEKTTTAPTNTTAATKMVDRNGND